MLTILRILFLALCPLVAAQAWADVVQLVPGQQRHDLNAAAEVLQDPSGQLDLTDVTTGKAAHAFQSAGPGLASFGFTDSAYWLRFRIDNPSNTPRKMLLVLRTNWLDTVRIFSPQGSEHYAQQLLGDTLPFNARAYAAPHFVVELEIAPGVQTYYLRLTSEQAFMTPVELWTAASFQESDRLWSAYYGMFYGVLLVMVLYNGFIWASTRDRNYLAYCAYLIAFFAMNFSYNGFAFQYLWPTSPRFGNWVHTQWIFGFLATAIVFSMQFLESRARLPRMHRLLQAYLVLMVASWIAVTVAGDAVAYNAAPVYFIFGCTPLILAAGLSAWRSGYRAARFFVLAFMASMAGSFFTALTVSGLLPYTFANFHAAEFGIMADVVLLSLALADRIKTLRGQREAAEMREMEHKLQTAALLKQANELLEQTVLERTVELARARDEAENLARIDVLTDVANRRYFGEIAAKEFARARRQAQPLSVLLIDIDLFKQINDTYGHAAGDAVLRAVADTARKSVRDMDFVARIGGEEFSILLPTAPIGQALATAERLRVRLQDCIVVHGGHAIAITASVGASELVDGDADFSSLLHRADQALYTAKDAGRNRVRPEPAPPQGG